MMNGLTASSPLRSFIVHRSSFIISYSMMTSVDYVVLLGYLLGILVVGVIFAGKNRSSSEMFAAGGQSPWWAAGLSGFMTMFSAATFVVWGGIAYEYGLVAVAINLCYGVAALLAGYFVAGRWKKLGLRTPAEFIRLRFGEAALHFYTWSMMLFRMVGVGVSLYSLALLLVALMPLEEGNPFRDPATGNLSLTSAIWLFGGIVVIYTMIGGLWAVLMTDVLQFIVLNLAVLFVAPLSLMQIGGVREFVERAPQGFFAPIAGGYTWFFLAGWCAIHFFTIGAEWAFVQRFICVPTEKDARKGAYLFGILYLVSPLLWMLPPMIWRIQSPIPPDATREQIQALAEQAYIHSCQAVLPAGMVGMMLAAMFSATASMVSGQLNVFAGVLTSDIYRPLVGRQASERQLAWVGRLCTLLLGGLVLAIALAVPSIGGARAVIVGITSLLVAPLLAPTVWGLLNRSVNAAAVWVTAVVCIPLSALLKFGFTPDGPLGNVKSFSEIAAWIQANQHTVDIGVGVVVPVIVLLLIQAGSKGTSIGWQRVAALAGPEQLRSGTPPTASRLPALVVGWSIAACGATMAALVYVNEEDRGVLAAFAGALLAIAAAILLWSRRPMPSAAARLEPSHVEV